MCFNINFVFILPKYQKHEVMMKPKTVKRLNSQWLIRHVGKVFPNNKHKECSSRNIVMVPMRPSYPQIEWPIQIEILKLLGFFRSLIDSLSFA